MRIRWNVNVLEYMKTSILSKLCSVGYDAVKVTVAGGGVNDCACAHAVFSPEVMDPVTFMLWRLGIW
jgi:hypothetical protein